MGNIYESEKRNPVVSMWLYPKIIPAAIHHALHGPASLRFHMPVIQVVGVDPRLAEGPSGVG